MNPCTFKLEDIIFIPGGQIVANNTAGKRLLPRLQKGLQLWKNKRSSFILVSGGITNPPNIQDEPEAVIMKKWLMENGASAEKILMEEYAFDTFENARLGLDLLRKLNIEVKTIEVVSERLHTIRVALSLRAFGFKGKIQRIPVSVPMDWKQLLFESAAIVYYTLDRKGKGWIARKKKLQRMIFADYPGLTS